MNYAACTSGDNKFSAPEHIMAMIVKSTEICATINKDPQNEEVGPSCKPY